MKRPIENYKLHIIEIKKLNDIFQYNSKIFAQGIDISGLLRAEIVFAISALDQYIHSVVLFQVMDILKSSKDTTPSFGKLSLRLDTIRNLLTIKSDDDIFLLIEKEISHNLSWKSFQQPDKIAEALRIICDKKIWEEISARMGLPVKEIREQLQLIVKRRDSIVHEADFDVVNQCQYSIKQNEVTESVNFLIKVVFMIDAIIFDYPFNDQMVDEHLLA